MVSTENGTATCEHGGAFFQGIGERFTRLERRHDVINADVLDAWFPPAPGVLESLREHLEWLIRTAPPTQCEGLIQAIAEARGIPADCIVPSAGSSPVIYRAFSLCVSPAAQVLLLDPTYGEYGHLCKQLLGCPIERLTLDRHNGYRVDPDELHDRLVSGAFDVAVIVNPNNPTGQHLSRETLEDILEDTPDNTLVWIDEAYVDFVDPAQSLERFAATRPNVVVCKSMSKAYALSGMRVGYMVGVPETIAATKAWTPPWVIGLPAQLAAVKALEARSYYQDCYRETRVLRGQLTQALRQAFPTWDIVEGEANFLLCRLPEEGPTAANVVDRCRERGLYLRDAGEMGTSLGDHVLRIAVKDAVTQERMLRILLANV